MLKKSIVWTNFADGKTVYKMFKDYDISSHVKDSEKVTYVRFTKDGSCFYRWTPQNSTLKEERYAYKVWIENNGYTELKMFNGDKEYAGTI